MQSQLNKTPTLLSKLVGFVFCALLLGSHAAGESPDNPGVLAVDAEHTQLVDHVAISPDGKFGASIAYDKQLKVWDIEQRRQIWTFNLLDLMSGLAFRPNATTLAVGQQNGTVALVDYTTGSLSNLRCGKEDHEAAITALRFSRDGRYLACGDSRNATVGIVDLGSNASDHFMQLYSSPGIKTSVANIAFANDGKHMAVAFFMGEVVVHDLGQHTSEMPCKLPSLSAQALTFTSQDHLVVAGEVSVDHQKIGDFVVYDCTSQRILATVKKGVSSLPGLASFSPDGTFLAFSGMVPGNAKLRVWNLPAKWGQDAHIEKSYTFGPVDINDSGEIFFIDSQKGVYFLPEPKTVVPFDSSPVQRIASLRFLKDGSLFVSRDGSASQWDFATGERTGLRVSNAAYSSDNSRVAYNGGHSNLEFYDNKIHKNINTHVPLPLISNMDISTDGKYVTWTEPDHDHKILKLIDLDDPHPTPTSICQVRNFVNNAAFFSGSNLLVIPCELGNSVDIQVRDTRQLQQPARHISLGDPLLSYCLSNHGTLIAVSTSTRVMLYDLLHEAAPPIILADDIPYSRSVVGFSDDDKVLATSLRKDGASSLEFWDINSQSNISIPVDAEVVAIAFGKTMIAVGLLNGTIEIIDLSQKKKLFTLLDSGAKDWLVISPNGRFDGTAAALRWVGWRNGSQIRPFEAYFATYYNPGLLFDLLQGVELHATSRTNKPAIDVQSIDSSVSSDQWVRPTSAKLVVHLLSVGVGKYKSSSGFPPLDYSRLDAAAFQTSFKDAFHTPALERLVNPVSLASVHVWKELDDKDATRDKILDEIKYIGDISKPEDIMILYFSGHGYVPPGSEMFYFEPFDAQGLTLDNQRKSAISTADLADLLRSAHAQRILLIIDSCQSGEALDSLAKLAEIKERVEQVKFHLGRVTTAETGVHILFAATSSEEAFASSDYQHSLLTEAIIEGLGAGVNPHVSAKALIEYVKHRLPEMVKKSGVQQTPMFTSVGVDIPLWQLLSR